MHAFLLLGCFVLATTELVRGSAHMIPDERLSTNKVVVSNALSQSLDVGSPPVLIVGELLLAVLLCFVKTCYYSAVYHYPQRNLYCSNVVFQSYPNQRRARERNKKRSAHKLCKQYFIVSQKY